MPGRVVRATWGVHVVRGASPGGGGGREREGRVFRAHAASHVAVPPPPLRSLVGCSLAHENARFFAGTGTLRPWGCEPPPGRADAHLSLIHISEPTRLGMISYAVFCLKKKKKNKNEETMYPNKTHRKHNDSSRERKT